MKTKELIERVNTSISKYDMINPCDSLLIGLSGGADSMALLHILLRLCPEFNLRLGIAHFNHCLRGLESERDAEFVCLTADQLNLPFFSEKVDIKKFSRDHKLSLEEAGRIARHRFLHQTAYTHGFDKIVLGHQKDDMAETVLINILRGSGSRGISGIPPRRGIIIRPLIDIRKSDIEDFLHSENILHITDSSNSDPGFHRNRIRLELIPLLATKYNKDVVEILSRTAKILRDEQNWVDSMINPLFKSVKILEEGPNVTLSVPGLKIMHPAAARLIIRKAILEVKGNLYGVKFKHMDAIFEIIFTDPSASKQIDLPGPIKIKRDNDRLTIVHRQNRGRTSYSNIPNRAQHSQFSYKINEPGRLYIKEIDQWIELILISQDQINVMIQSNFTTGSPHEAYMDMAQICFPLTVRSWQPGDRFSPLGLSGSQKVKEFLTNQKVPVSKKINIAILESAGKIIWVAGFRIDNLVKLKSTSKKGIRAKMLNELHTQK